jgi:hypothetical protein
MELIQHQRRLRPGAVDGDAPEGLFTRWRNLWSFFQKAGMSGAMGKAR